MPPFSLTGVGVVDIKLDLRYFPARPAEISLFAMCHVDFIGTLKLPVIFRGWRRSQNKKLDRVYFCSLPSSQIFSTSPAHRRIRLAVGVHLRQHGVTSDENVHADISSHLCGDAEANIVLRGIPMCRNVISICAARIASVPAHTSLSEFLTALPPRSQTFASGSGRWSLDRWSLIVLQPSLNNGHQFRQIGRTLQSRFLPGSRVPSGGQLNGQWWSPQTVDVPAVEMGGGRVLFSAACLLQIAP